MRLNIEGLRASKKLITLFTLNKTGNVFVVRQFAEIRLCTCRFYTNWHYMFFK
jgi:hypothetical protein